MAPESELGSYRLLGRSGLRVSPLALGTLTFGTEWGFGADEAEARRIFDAYVDHGGNFIDTANNYTNGNAETWVGRFAAGRRDRLVLSTKYSFRTARDPNSGGNHRKSMVRAVEASLRRMATDYIDLYFVHAWDGVTPTDEVMRALDDLVRSGKVLYLGISDTPAWQVARMQTMAELRGWTPLVGLQVEYSLVERTAERELLPMGAELGLGVIPWGVLAAGVLSGKRRQSEGGAAGSDNALSEARLNGTVASGRPGERSYAIAQVAQAIAAEVGRSPSEVAIAWTLANPQVTSPLIGARTLAQLETNLRALSLELHATHLARLDEASRIEPGFPHEFLATERVRANLGADVQRNGKGRGATAGPAWPGAPAGIRYR
jgi:aryl-alcohol dehydrogenase-like predicted oxidoreductase